MTTEYEHKIHELKVIEDPGSDHPLIVQTRDNIHAADLSYALTKGHLIGEPADLALNREQLQWLRRKQFDDMQQKYYGQVYEVPPPIKPEDALKAAEANVADESTPAQQRAIDLGRELAAMPDDPRPAMIQENQPAGMTAWMSEVAAGNTTLGFDDWMRRATITHYEVDRAFYEVLSTLLTERQREQFKPIYEVKS
jgi:ubiquitin